MPKLITHPTLADFYHVHYIPWTNCEEVLGKRRYKQLLKWMEGQTCTAEGIYPHDLDRFLKNLPVID